MNDLRFGKSLIACAVLLCVKGGSVIKNTEGGYTHMQGLILIDEPWVALPKAGDPYVKVIGS